MGFTDKCDIFASFHEDAFNNLLRHAMRQRPSLFNYATKAIAGKPQTLCERIDVHPIVSKRGNPVVTIVDPLPIPGTVYGMNFSVQLVDLRIDFHPGNQFNLPPELAPLGKQRFALRLKACAGIGCPPDEYLDRLIPPPEDPNKKTKNPNQPFGEAKDQRDEREKTPQPLIPLPTGGLICFCLEAFIVGSMSFETYYEKPFLEMNLGGFEIVDIKPEGLENGIECYVKTMLRLAVLPQLRILVEATVLDLKDYLDNLKKSVIIKIKPTPGSADVPNNPAIEDNQVRIFVNMEVS